MNRKIYLVRHGKIDSGEKKCYIGITDMPLSAEGILQAQKLRKFFSTIDLEKVYVSPLKRCIQTTDTILMNRNIEKVIAKEFLEINMGQWEGKTFEYIKSYFPEQFKERGKNIDTFIPTGGESFEQLKARVIPAFKASIVNSSGNILIVAHAGVNRIILSYILSIPLKEAFTIFQDYGCVNELCWDDICKRWQWKMLL